MLIDRDLIMFLIKSHLIIDKFVKKASELVPLSLCLLEPYYDHALNRSHSRQPASPPVAKQLAHQ